MSELSERQTEMLRSIAFATEFLKVVRGLKVESDRFDGFPDDLKEHLANEHLNRIIAENNYEPELLIWGLLHMIEMLLKYNNLDPEDLTEVMESLIAHVKANPDKYGDS